MQLLCTLGLLPPPWLPLPLVRDLGAGGVAHDDGVMMMMMDLNAGGYTSAALEAQGETTTWREHGVLSRRRPPLFELSGSELLCVRRR